VGAPWEESGVIYIYNGDASLKDKMEPVMSQTIAMQSDLCHHLPASKESIRTFGFSISEPIDIDGNGLVNYCAILYCYLFCYIYFVIRRYADIAIGAFKSGHVIILRGKPIVRTNLTVYTVPSTLERNVSNFSVTACVEYRGYDMADKHGEL